MSARFHDGSSVAVCLIAGGLALACGAPPLAQRLRYADTPAAAAHLDWSRPIELEFEPGDRLPIRFTFSDQAFELVPASPPFELVATRRSVVRIEGGRITKSLTGDFEQRPLARGTFRFGLAITPQGKSLELAISTPRVSEPPPPAP